MPFYFYIIIGVIGFFLLLFLVYLFLLKTKREKGLKEYKGALFAHRGLHGEGRAENSMSAFLAAVEAGYGIELDIRLSADGQVVVFHDDTLLRVCGIDKRVNELTAEELSRLSLSGTADGVPTFAEVLAAVDGKVPLLVEIKEDRGECGVTPIAAEMLKNYKGKFIVESFNPLSLKAYKKYDPSVICGVLSQSYWKEKKFRKGIYYMLGALVTNIFCRPSFIAFNIEHKGNLALKIARFFFRTPTFAWTVRSDDDGKMALKSGFDGLIFENYLPELPKGK